jgi:hypothetical protein
MMKHKLRALLLCTGLLLASLSGPLTVSAAGSSIYLSANRSTVANGGTLIVAVYMNGGGNPVNTVEADLSYPASKLNYVGLNYAGSAFEITAPSNGGSGTVNIARGTTGTVSGSGLVATVTFTATASSGSAAISLLGSSALASDGNAIAAGTSGVNVSFGAVAPVATSKSVPAAKPATPIAPAVVAPKDTTPPVISAVKVTGLTPYAGTITWTTNEPSSSEVDFGLDNTYGISSSSAALTTSHNVALSSSFLTPLTLLHYRVKSIDASGNVASSADQTLQLPGVPVTIVVLGANGKPQAGATVTVDNRTATTNSNGSATIASSLGNKQVTTSYDGMTVQKTITVAKTAKTLPPYQLDLNKQPVNGWMYTSFGLVFVILVLLGVDALLFGSRIFLRISGLHKLQPKVADTTSHIPHSTLTNDVPIASALADETPIDVTKTVSELMELTSQWLAWLSQLLYRLPRLWLMK